MLDQNKIDELYLGAPIYRAMKFWTLPKHRQGEIEDFCVSGEYYAQTKKDGNWYLYSKSTEGKSYLFSRGISVKTDLPVEGIEKVPHIEEALSVLPNDSVIVGEVYYPGETTAAVRSIMGCLPPRAIKRQKERGNIHYYLFDILRLDGEDLTELGSLDRYKKLVEVVEEYGLLTNEIELADCVTENIYEFLIGNFAKGEEGSILKKKDHPYVENKAPAWSSIKWKKQGDVDVVCMGFEDATKNYTGKEEETWEYWEVDGELKLGNHYGEKGAVAVTKPYYHGWVMSVAFGLYQDGELKQVGTVSSGMDDELRKDASDNPEKYIGRVMKLNYMELTDDAIREPVLVEFRDDKGAEECLYSEVFK